MEIQGSVVYGLKWTFMFDTLQASDISDEIKMFDDKIITLTNIRSILAKVIHIFLVSKVYGRVDAIILASTVLFISSELSLSCNV